MQKVHSVLLTAVLGIFLANLPVSQAAEPSAAQTSASPADSGSRSEATADKERYQQDVVNHKDLPNFHEVHPFLYRSGEPSAAGLDEAKQLGIRTIIDLRAPSERKGDEQAWCKERGLKYINLVMSSKAPTKQQVKTFLSTVKDAEQHPEKGKVLVHCAHGSDRTGCMVGIWRVTQDGWNYDKAYQEMRHYWFGPKFTNLSGAVREYAEQGAP